MTIKSFDANDPEARAFLLDRRGERNHPKRHRTRKRRKAITAAKKAKIDAKLKRMKEQRSAYLARSRAYWRGEDVGHP